MEMLQETIRYREIQPKDISSLRSLNDASFPIKYDDSFYTQVKQRSRRGFKLYTFVATYFIPQLTNNTELDLENGEGMKNEEYLVGAITFQISPIQDRDHDENIVEYLNNPLVDINKQACYIMTVAVHDNFRQRGIASTLLRHCLDVVAEYSDCAMTYLHVIYWNQSAMSLYRKFGFEEFMKLNNFYSFDAKNHDAFLFGKLHPTSDAGVGVKSLPNMAKLCPELEDEEKFGGNSATPAPSIFKRLWRSIVVFFGFPTKSSL